MKKEQGLPILIESGCFIGQHIFIHTGAGYCYTTIDSNELKYSKLFQRCNCGLYTWEEIAKEEENERSSPRP